MLLTFKQMMGHAMPLSYTIGENRNTKGILQPRKRPVSLTDFNKTHASSLSHWVVEATLRNVITHTTTLITGDSLSSEGQLQGNH